MNRALVNTVPYQKERKKAVGVYLNMVSLCHYQIHNDMDGAVVQHSQGPHSISSKTPFAKLRLAKTRSHHIHGFRLFEKFSGVSITALVMRLPKVRTSWSSYYQISRFRIFARSYDKWFYHWKNRDPRSHVSADRLVPVFVTSMAGSLSLWKPSRDEKASFTERGAAHTVAASGKRLCWTYLPDIIQCFDFIRSREDPRVEKNTYLRVKPYNIRSQDFI